LKFIKEREQDQNYTSSLYN